MGLIKYLKNKKKLYDMKCSNERYKEVIEYHINESTDRVNMWRVLYEKSNSDKLKSLYENLVIAGDELLFHYHSMRKKDYEVYMKYQKNANPLYKSIDDNEILRELGIKLNTSPDYTYFNYCKDLIDNSIRHNRMKMKDYIHLFRLRKHLFFTSDKEYSDIYYDIKKSIPFSNKQYQNMKKMYKDHYIIMKSSKRSLEINSVNSELLINYINYLFSSLILAPLQRKDKDIFGDIIKNMTEFGVEQLIPIIGYIKVLCDIAETIDIEQKRIDKFEEIDRELFDLENQFNDVLSKVFVLLYGRLEYLLNWYKSGIINEIELQDLVTDKFYYLITELHTNQTAE